MVFANVVRVGDGAGKFSYFQSNDSLDPKVYLQTGAAGLEIATDQLYLAKSDGHGAGVTDIVDTVDFLLSIQSKDVATRSTNLEHYNTQSVAVSNVYDTQSTNISTFIGGTTVTLSNLIDEQSTISTLNAQFAVDSAASVSTAVQAKDDWYASVSTNLDMEVFKYSTLSTNTDTSLQTEETRYATAVIAKDTEFAAADDELAIIANVLASFGTSYNALVTAFNDEVAAIQAELTQILSGANGDYDTFKELEVAKNTLSADIGLDLADVSNILAAMKAKFDSLVGSA